MPCLTVPCMYAWSPLCMYGTSQAKTYKYYTCIHTHIYVCNLHIYIYIYIYIYIHTYIHTHTYIYVCNLHVFSSADVHYTHTHKHIDIPCQLSLLLLLIYTTQGIEPVRFFKHSLACACMHLHDEYNTICTCTDTHTGRYSHIKIFASHRLVERSLACARMSHMQT